MLVPANISSGGVGEYEVYKTGTTLTQLKGFIAALTREEYYDSFITINDGDTQAESDLLMPKDGRSFVKKYQNVTTPYNSTLLSVSNTILYNSNNDSISYSVMKCYQNNSTKLLEVATTSPTITAFTIYKRKKIS